MTQLGNIGDSSLLFRSKEATLSLLLKSCYLHQSKKLKSFKASSSEKKGLRQVSVCKSEAFKPFQLRFQSSRKSSLQAWKLTCSSRVWTPAVRNVQACKEKVEARDPCSLDSLSKRPQPVALTSFNNFRTSDVSTSERTSKLYVPWLRILAVTRNRCEWEGKPAPPTGRERKAPRCPETKGSAGSVWLCVWHHCCFGATVLLHPLLLCKVQGLATVRSYVCTYPIMYVCL